MFVRVVEETGLIVTMKKSRLSVAEIGVLVASRLTRLRVMVY